MGDFSVLEESDMDYQKYYALCQNDSLLNKMSPGTFANQAWMVLTLQSTVLIKASLGVFLSYKPRLSKRCFVPLISSFVVR